MAEPRSLDRRFTSTERLWVCHTCEMIGEQAEAERHVELKGHRVDQLSQEISDGIRDEWRANRITEAELTAPAVGQSGSVGILPGGFFAETLRRSR